MALGSVKGNHAEHHGHISEPQRTPAPPWDPHGSRVTPGLSPTSRGDSTVPSAFPAELESAHTPLSPAHWGEKKKEKKEKKKKPASRSRKCTFQTPTPFPRAGGGKPAISCFPSLPGALCGTHASRPLTSSLHRSGTRTRAFPAPGKGLGAREGGRWPGCISK